MNPSRLVRLAHGTRLSAIRDAVAAVEHSTTTPAAIATAAGLCRIEAGFLSLDGRDDLATDAETIALLLEDERTTRMDRIDVGDLAPESSNDRAGRRAAIRAAMSNLEREVTAWLNEHNSEAA